MDKARILGWDFKIKDVPQGLVEITPIPMTNQGNATFKELSIIDNSARIPGFLCSGDGNVINCFSVEVALFFYEKGHEFVPNRSASCTFVKE
jgi:hypothetical protein